MKKRKLALDTLRVESFSTAGPRAPRGTVRAQELTPANPCFPQDTLYDSCGWSEIDCYTQGCRTDFQTCGQFGSCCPAICQ
ncbi:MAG TPA: hypothetical protein VF092_27460 [Longimicrobium sp.]